MSEKYFNPEGREIPKIEIQEMPTKEILENFLRKLYGVRNGVVFDLPTGKFIDMEAKDQSTSSPLSNTDLPINK